MTDDGPIFAGPSKSIINPEVLFSSVDKKVKSFLNPNQVVTFAATEALQKYHKDPDIDVLESFIEELRENSRALDGVTVQTYAKVAEKRIEVDDRKRVFQKEENTM